MDRRHHVCGQEDSDEASTPGAGVAMIGVAMEFLVAEVNLDLIVIISFLDILEMMLKSNLIFHQQKSVLFCGGLPFFFGGEAPIWTIYVGASSPPGTLPGCIPWILVAWAMQRRETDPGWMIGRNEPEGHGGVLVQRILMNFSYFQWVIFRFQPFIFRGVNCTRDAGNNAVARTSTCQRTCRARITLCVDGPLVFVVDPNSLLTDHGPKQVKLRKRI